MNKAHIKNGVITLVVLSVIAKIIGVFYRIPLFTVLGSNGMGIYQLVFPIYALSVAFIGGGAPVAVSRLTSISKWKNDAEKMEKTVNTALIIFGGTGLLISIVLFVFAQCVSLFLGNSATKIPILVLAPSVFFSSIIAVLRGYNQGVGKNLKVGVSYVVEQVLKLLGIAFAFLFSSFYNLAVVGAMLGITVGEAVTACYLTVGYLRRKKYAFSVNKSIVKDLLSAGVFVSFSSLIFPLGTLFDGVLIVKVLSKSVSNATALYGLFSGVVSPLIAMPSVINSSFNSFLLPKLCASEKSNRRSIFGFYAKFPLGISLIISVSMAVFSKEILTFLYPLAEKELAICIRVLIIGSPIVFLSCAMSLVNTYLQSENKTYFLPLNSFIAVVVKLILTPFAINSFSIFGAQVCSIIFYLIAFVLASVQAVKVGFGFSIKTVLALASSTFTFAFFACGIYALYPTLLGCILAFATGGSVGCIVFSLLTNKNRKELLPSVKKG
jgi:stage V sporulation protein B